MAGYSREFVTSPFCPELAFDFDPEHPNNITISWSEAKTFENVIPHGEMTLDDAGNLADKDGFHEVKVIKLDKFLVLRVRNSDFWRVLYLYPVSGTRDSLLGDLLGFMMSTHSDFMKSDGPAWYICSRAYFPVTSEGDR
ncbi:hypothetical protein R5R35_003430 [Gryllus longicercus]|uniref:Uncharacterized protein n=1 Tax=Gryllus longicercus TaxID=2509291 RepID=A0AAN9VTT4_9ORTH